MNSRFEGNFKIMSKKFFLNLVEISYQILAFLRETKTVTEIFKDFIWTIEFREFII